MSTRIANFDVVVVGGGPGGAYAAWRAQTGAAGASSPLPPDPAQRRVLLLESSGRIGGRLESIVAPGTSNLVAEFGGMGFRPKERFFRRWSVCSGSTPCRSRCRATSPTCAACACRAASVSTPACCSTS